MSSSDELLFEKNRKTDTFTDHVKRRRYTKWKLLELRKNKKCQEWPKVLNKRFIGIDGKWDPVGAFETNNFPQRAQSRDERPREDYNKYYWYGENSKRYNSYSSNHSYYFSNSKTRYDYDDEIVYESNRKRMSPSDYYTSYYQGTNKSRNMSIDKDNNDATMNDNKPEWFTGGPSNINETIELSGMSRELEAGILKNRNKNIRRNEDECAKSTELEPNFNDFKDDDPAQIDSHLLKIIKNNAKEKDKRKTTSSAKEVEKVLKSILLRPQDEVKEASTLAPNSNGVVRTVNEIEANLKLKGNRGAGDMSAYYKLLGLVQNNYDQNPSESKVSNEKSINHSETSTNNNHPRQFTNSKYPTSTIKNTKNYMKINEEIEVDNYNKTVDNLIIDQSLDESKGAIKEQIKTEIDNTSKFDETNLQNDIKKLNGYNNFNSYASNPSRPDRINMNSRGVCNPLSGQFSNHMLGTGQNAYRWIRAMNNAAAASARITQMNQSEYNTSEAEKVENKTEQEPVIQSAAECAAMDSYNNTMENSYRANMDANNSTNQMGAFVNSYNYMTPGAPLFNQMPIKPFFPYNFAQNSLFGRQFINPYLLQQLFLHKQWENRNISLQNQIRQFQSMIFNCNSPQQPAPTMNNGGSNTGYNASNNTLPLNQGDCSAISVNK